MKIIKIIFVWLGLCSFQLLQAQSSPVPMLEGSANQIIQTLKDNKSTLKSNKQVVYGAIQRYLLPHVDLEGMSRSVLGRQAWMKASPDEKRKFTAAFTQLVIRTYATPLAEYSGETIQFLPVRGSTDGRFLRVNSVISRPSGQTIPLSYNLVSKNGEWKVYDLSVEGVSLLQSFRSQFGEVLQNASMDDLIKQMNQAKKSA